MSFPRPPFEPAACCYCMEKLAAISPPFSLSPVSTVVVVTLYYGGFSYCISITERVNSSGNTKKSLWKGAKWGRRKARVACFMNLMLLSKVSTDGISKWSLITAIKGQIVNTKDHTSTSIPVKTMFCSLAINST